MLSAENLAAVVVDAMAKSPPRNGEKYVLAFANLDRGITFCAKVEEGIKKNAEAAGIELVIADNNLDGATALTNAESFINRNVDYVIEFQTDANFGATIMQKMNEAGIKVTAIDIPMPGATFFGANNPKSGYMGGVYLGQAAIEKFGADKVKEGYFILGELPQSGAVPAMRTGGQLAGFLAIGRRLPRRPRHHHRHQEHPGGKLRADQQRARPHPGRRADHGDRDQRSVDDRHSPRGQAGGTRGRSHRRRHGR